MNGMHIQVNNAIYMIFNVMNVQYNTKNDSLDSKYSLSTPSFVFLPFRKELHETFLSPLLSCFFSFSFPLWITHKSTFKFLLQKLKLLGGMVPFI
jgi:DNA-binding transcriptional regulator/RsmH inhibitor MraZ